MKTKDQGMAPSDVAWFHMDRPDNHMVINALAWSEQPFEHERVVQTIEERWVSVFPRLTQRVTGKRSGSGERLRWTACPDFRLADHFRFRTLPAPGDVDALCSYVSEQAGTRLEQASALWEVHVLDGFETGGAILIRIHHAIADGHLVVRLLRELDESSAPSLAEEAAARSVADGGQAVSPGWSSLARGLKWMSDPGRAGRGLADLAAIGSVAVSAPGGARAAHAPLSGRKDLRWCPPIDLDNVLHRCRRRGITVNDFFIAAVAGGLRSHLARQARLDGDMRAIIPVDLRSRTDPIDIELGNHFGLGFVLLPLADESPSRRLRTIKRRMDDLKAGDEARITFDWIRMSGRAGATLGFNLIEAFARHCSLIISNIAGPRAPIVLGRAPVSGMTAWVPTSGPMGIGVCVLSYAGKINFGLSVDRGVVEAPDRLMAAITDELALLGRLEA